MYHFTDTSKDFEDLCSNLSTEGIEFETFIDLGKAQIDCWVFHKTYSDGSDVCSFLYINKVTDVVDYEGRPQYNGTVYSVKKEGYELVFPTADKVKFQDANYLGLWLCISATNQAVIEGSENYEYIKTQLILKNEAACLDSKESLILYAHLELVQKTIDFAEAMLADELAEEYEFEKF